MNRSYTLLNVKRVDQETRTLYGIATTPATDRMDDVVESRGAVFKLPIPLLWQHDQGKPIGHVIEASVTDDGIEIVAQIAKIEEAGTLKDFVDHSWSAIKAGLVRGLSIGFKGLSSEPIPGTYGTRFKKWLWLELSAVTIPANAEASIMTVKKYDFRGDAVIPATTASEQELDEFRRHEREILAKMGISDDLAKKPVSMREFCVGMNDVIEAFRTLTARIEAVEKADRYRGVHQRALSYPAGSLVTYRGDLWAALGSVPKGVVPGLSDLWQLAAKNGKPVKAAKVDR